MPVLQARKIAKRYGGVIALHGCSLTLEAGQVHALLGENGAGKSTLVKIIAGAVQTDSGDLLLDGEPQRFASTLEAAAKGIAVVSQELNVFPDLDVLANMFLMREPRRHGLVDRRAMAQLAGPVLAELGLDVSPRALVADLTLAQRQLVEIGKALLANPRVLVLDEPTSALDENSSARLLEILRILRERQVAVVFVSHILEEVMQVSDRITVMRDGRVVVASADRAGMTIPRIVDAMLGDRQPDLSTEDQVDLGVAGPAPLPGRARSTGIATLPQNDRTRQLRLVGVHSGTALKGVDLLARFGEVVGLAGIVGAGHLTVLDVIGGAATIDAGQIFLPGDEKPSRSRTLRAAVRRGVGIVSGDRTRGLIQDSAIWVNITQVRSVTLGRDGILLRRSLLRRRAEIRARDLGVKAENVEQVVSGLSGGNQQKVVLAKWLEAEPRVLLLDDPTRGVDIGAKLEMHHLIRAAGEGMAVLLCSSDIEELATVCDRVLVFRAGRIAVELSGDRLTRHDLLVEMNASDAPVG